MSSQERRRLERFDLQASAKIIFECEGGTQESLSLMTRDVSSSGAYILTPRPLPEGMPVRLELLLSLDVLMKILGEGGQAKVKVKGKVIRADDCGMAIVFDNKFKFLTMATSST
jgi:hypothetical protein